MDKLYLYKIWQDSNNKYDTYDSAVVVAESEEAARKIDPDGRVFPIERWGKWDWVEDPAKVKVKLIGEAAEGLESCVVIASYNAG